MDFTAFANIIAIPFPRAKSADSSRVSNDCTEEEIMIFESVPSRSLEAVDSRCSSDHKTYGEWYMRQFLPEACAS